jgi:hypothetical protein
MAVPAIVFGLDLDFTVHNLPAKREEFSADGIF